MPPSDEFKKALRAGDLPEAFMMAMGKATELNITTRVMGADGNVTGESNPAQTLHTRLDLLNGTIDNEVGEEFLSSGQYKELQHFHQQQVALGNRKIQENFQSLQQLFQLLVTLQQYNRLNNSEEPLDLGFLDVPSHLLPTEKVITTLKEREQQQAILELFPTPQPSTSPETALEELEELDRLTEEILEPPAPEVPKRPAPIPPKPMAAFGIAAVAGAAIAKSQGKQQKAKLDDGDEPLNFLDGFAALDLDAERDPIMSVSDLEMDDWEAPAEMSPAQRNAQQTTTAYVPSLNDFDHDELEDDVADLDDLLGDDDLDPLADFLDDSSVGDLESDEFAAHHTADLGEFAPEDFPAEVLEGLLETDEADEENFVGSISLGQSSPHAPQEAVDPDLEALLEEADVAHDALEELEIFDSLESLPEAIAPETLEPLAEPDALLPETVLTETSFGELLEAADAMTPEMTVDLLDETLDETEDFPVDMAVTAEPATLDSGIEDLEDVDLLDFINQDWQSHPEVMEITSLDDDGDGDKALLQPLSAEELAELEEMSRTDDDWQPLTGAGEFSALNLDLADTAQALPVETAEDLEDDLIDDDWQPLAGKAHEAIDIGSLLPLELGNEGLETELEDDFGRTDELDLLDMEEMDLDLEENLEMPLSRGGGDLGTLDSVDPEAAFDQEDLDFVEMPDEMLDLGEAFGEDFSTDLGDVDGLGGLDGLDDDDLLGEEALDDIDGFTETTDDFELAEDVDFGEMGDLDESGLDLTDESLDNLDGFTETTDDFELADSDFGEMGDLDESGLDLTDESLDNLDGFTESNDDFELAEDADFGELEDVDLDESGLDLTDESLDNLDGFTETTDDFELADSDFGEMGDLGESGLDLTLDNLDGFTETTDDFELAEDADFGELEDVDLDESGLDLTDETDNEFAENWLDGAIDEETEGEPFGDLNADPIADLADPFAGTDDLWDQRGEAANFAVDETLEALSDAAFSAEMDIDDLGLDDGIDDFGDLDSPVASMDGDTDNWLDQFDEASPDDDNFGLGSDLGEEDELSENFSFDDGLSDEVLDSINELDEATAALLSSDEEIEDEALFDGLDSTAIDGFGDPEAEDILGDLGMGDDDLDEMPLTSDFENELDDNNWDADLDAALLDPDLDDDSPIDLDIKDLSDGDFALSGFDDEDDLETAPIAKNLETENDWDDLAIATEENNSTDWGELENPVSQGDSGENWEIADLEGLGDFDAENLSGLADFDLEALESDDSDDDFDLFGNEDSEALNPFFESKS